MKNKISISTAREIAVSHGFDRVIVAGYRDGEVGNTLRCTASYGKNRAHCHLAGRLSDVIREGVPEGVDAREIGQVLVGMGNNVLRKDRLLKAAMNALRSYQHGNGSPDLAKAMADQIDDELYKLGREIDAEMERLQGDLGRAA